MQDQQINVRVADEVVKKLDARRVQLASELERIPSRSEVVRIALDRYLSKTRGSAKTPANSDKDE